MTPAAPLAAAASLSPAERGKLTARAAAASITMAVSLLGLKVWAAIATGSVSVLGSLADTGLDVLASLITFYAVRLAAASRPGQKGTPDFINDLVSWGAGLRAGQYLVLGGKAQALLDGRSYVSSKDIQALAKPVLRHRILPNYRAEAQGVTVDSLVDRLLAVVEHPKNESVA